VHLSFVRSSTLDSWTDEQLRLVAAGGNQRARTFFKQHGWEEVGADKIEAKYTSRAAQLYRRQLERDAARLGADGEAPPAAGAADAGPAAPAGAPRPPPAAGKLAARVGAARRAGARGAAPLERLEARRFLNIHEYQVRRVCPPPRRPAAAARPPRLSPPPPLRNSRTLTRLSLLTHTSSHLLTPPLLHLFTTSRAPR